MKCWEMLTCSCTLYSVLTCIHYERIHPSLYVVSVYPLYSASAAYTATNAVFYSTLCTTYIRYI